MTNGVTILPEASGRTIAEGSGPTVALSENQRNDPRLEFVRDEFIRLRDSFNLQTDGDLIERQFVERGLLRLFPSYEEAWRILIVPATNRIVARADDRIGLRPGIADRIHSMCQFHYSMMKSLLIADGKTRMNQDGSIQEFVMHLENAYEQAESFFIFWILNFAPNKPKGVKKLNVESTEMRSRGRRKDILKEYFGGTWANFNGAHTNIKDIRDHLLHGPIPLTIISRAGTILHPSFIAIKRNPPRNNHLFWREVLQRNPDALRVADFDTPENIMQAEFAIAISSFERLWASQLALFNNDFFLLTPMNHYRLRITS